MSRSQRILGELLKTEYFKKLAKHEIVLEEHAGGDLLSGGVNANVHSKRELIIFKKIIIRTYGFDSLSDEQVRFVLGHELAHIRQNHEWNLFNLGLSLLFGLFLFLLIFVAIFSSLFLAIVLGGIASGFYSYYFYRNSQKKEYEADEVAFLASGGGQEMIDEINSLMSSFDSSIDPYFSSHPSARDRIKALQIIKQT